jgi:hypothetical protein
MSERPYKILCISLYEDDIVLLDAAVERLKRHVRSANRSALLRAGLLMMNDAQVAAFLRSEVKERNARRAHPKRRSAKATEKT